MPPTVPSRLGDLELACHLLDVLALAEQLVALGEQADDLLGAVPASLHVVSSSLPHDGVSDSHNGWISSRGSGQSGLGNDRRTAAGESRLHRIARRLPSVPRLAAACAPAFWRITDLISSQPHASARKPSMIMVPTSLQVIDPNCSPVPRATSIQSRALSTWSGVRSNFSSGRGHHPAL